MSDKEIGSQVEFWQDVAVRALQILQNRVWLQRENYSGRELYDFIAKYIGRCVDPDDNFWKRNRHPDPAPIIAKNAFRDILDYLKSERNVTAVELGDEESIEDFAEKSEQLIDGVINDTFIELIMKKYKDDDDLHLVLITMKQGYLKTGEIAQELGLDPNKVSKIKKKIRDGVVAVAKEWRS